MGTAIIICFLICLAIGVPIALTIGIATALPGIIDPSFAADAQFIIRNIIGGADNTPLLALPLFIIAGTVMAKGGISKKLFDVFAYAIGNVTAGIPAATIVTCLFYGAISGSGPATCAAVGTMAIPFLVSLGYDVVWASALVAMSSGLGVIIPPSIPYITYGISTGTSVADLFIAGIMPGILIAAILIGYSYIYCKVRGEDKETIRAKVGQLREQSLWSLLRESIWALLSPVIILGGIYSGILTPTEAAAASVLYSLIVSLFIYRTIRFGEILDLLRESVRAFAPLCFMLALANAFGKVLVLMDVPNMLANLIVDNLNSKFLFLLAINALFLVLGMFIDAGPALIILAPMVLPTAVGFGIDPVHLGIIMTVNLCVGYVSPPFGMNLFVAAPIAGVNVIDIGKKAVPFMIMFIAALVIICAFPSLSMFLLGR